MLVHIRIGDEEKVLTWDEWELHVRSGRVPPDALVLFEPVTGDDYRRAGDLEMFRSLQNEAALAWQSSVVRGPPPILTALLVGVQIRIWWFAWVPEIQGELVDRFTNWTPPALEDGEVWRMLTMGLLQVKGLHLFLNMMWLAYTGWNLERALGRKNLAAIYIASVLGGSILSMAGSPQTPSLGASGGVFGLIAASVVFGFLRPDQLPERGRRLFGMALLPYLLLMFFSGLSNERTDNWSHLGGMLTGGVLALLLDPEPLERRKGWNARIRWSLFGGGLALMVGLALFGPRIYPLLESETARKAWLPKSPLLDDRPVGSAPKAEPYRSLTWSVPAGWAPRINAAGDTSFNSPVGARSFSVREFQEDEPTTVDAVREKWQARVARALPDAVFGEPTPVEFVGREGQAMRVQLDDRVLEWRATVRGTWALQEVWEVDTDRVSRLTSLRDRLRASVEWGDPQPLVEARLGVAHLPKSVKQRAALAEALADSGEPAEAIGLWEDLIAERPSREHYVGLLEVVRWYPGQADVEGIAARALAAHNNPRMVVEIAVTLESQGDRQAARGLLELAWTKWPGDRKLRRARRKRGMTTELHVDSNQSHTLLFDRLQWQWRTAEEVGARALPTVDIEGARVAGVAYDAEQDALVAAALATRSEPELLRPLLALSVGGPAAAPEETVKGMLEELETVQQDGTVLWMPSALREALAPDIAEVVARLRELEPDDVAALTETSGRPTIPE